MAALASQSHAAGYSVRMLSPLLTGNDAQGTAISEDGTVVGRSNIFTGLKCEVVDIFLACRSHSPRPVVWAPGALWPTSLSCLPGAVSSAGKDDLPCKALALNASGVIVGESSRYNTYDESPVQWPKKSSSARDLSSRGSPTGTHYMTSVYDINAQGWMVGTGFATAPQTGQAAVWRAGQVEILDTAGADFGGRARRVNAAGLIAGTAYFLAPGAQYYNTQDTAVLIWPGDGRTLRMPSVEGLTVVGADVNDVSERGHVVGTFRHAAGAGGFMWLDGQAQHLTPPEGYEATANGVNSAGVVVGNIRTLNNYDLVAGDAVIWQNGVRRLLSELATPPDDYVFMEATGINDKGQIVGTMKSGYKLRGFVLTPKP